MLCSPRVYLAKTLGLPEGVNILGVSSKEHHFIICLSKVYTGPAFSILFVLSRALFLFILSVKSTPRVNLFSINFLRNYWILFSLKKRIENYFNLRFCDYNQCKVHNQFLSKKVYLLSIHRIYLIKTIISKHFIGIQKFSFWNWWQQTIVIVTVNNLNKFNTRINHPVPIVYTPTNIISNSTYL